MPAIMEGNAFTQPKHFYEQNKCSGTFMYIIDDCEASYIRFNAKITLQVVLDKNEFESEEDLSVGDDLKTSQRQSGDIDSVQDCDGNIKHDNNSDDDEDELTREILSPKYNNDTVQNNKQCFTDSCNNTKDTFYNDEENATFKTECEASKRVETKLRQRSYMLDHEVMCVRTRARIKPKTLKAHKCKGATNTKSKGMKTEVTKEDKSKQYKQVLEGGSELNETETDLNSIDTKKRRIGKHKQSKPQKLKISQTIQCDYCHVVFSNKIDFYSHRKNEGARFECVTCGKVEPFQAHLMVHMLSHEPDKGYADTNGERNETDVKRGRHKLKCSVCGLVRSSVDSLKVHMMLHTEESPYRCCVCKNKAFFSLSSLHHHQDTHKESERFQCKECKKRFSSRSELSKHKFSHQVKCDLCGEFFPNKTSRKCHYRISHSNEVKKCTECLGLFATDEELQKHILYHRREKKEQCPICGLVVTKLKIHMAIHATTGGDNMFACNQCPLKYKRKGCLNKHLLSHTGEKPYVCSMCPKRFTSNGMLHKHLLTHTLERPFVCGLCGKQFSLRSNLVTHTRIHSETRKFPCPHCLQAFNYKNSLDIHIKCKHKKVETSPLLSCDHCFQTFEDESSQRAHLCAGHRIAVTTSNEINQEQERVDSREQSMMLEPEQPLPKQQQQQQLLPNVEDQMLMDRQEENFVHKREESFPSLREDQTLYHKLDHKHLQEQSMINEENGPSAGSREVHLVHRQYVPYTLPLEHTYIPQEPSMFVNIKPPHANQTSSSLHSHFAPQKAPMHPVFDFDVNRTTRLESRTNLSIPTCNANFSVDITPSNMIDSHDYKRKRRHDSNSESSSISSMLSAPPLFHGIPPAIETVSHLTGNVISAISSKIPSGTNDSNKQGSL